MKNKKVAIVLTVALALLLVCANVLPFTTWNNTNVANAVTVSSREEWSNPYSGTYYDNLNESLTGTAFRTELASLITKTHTHETTYNDLKEIFKTTDADPNNPGNVIWFYTGTSVPYTGAMDSGNYPTNREHVWPKMAGKAFPESSQAGSDAHHLRPLNTGLNNTRSNYQFGEVAQTETARVKQTGTYANYGTDDPDTWCYLSGSLFYPAKGYRGATARILFYLQTRWGDVSQLYFVLGNGNTKSMGHIDTLLKWHLEEPPTDEEIRRNEAVAKIQGNRNPFIDHPEYAEMIYCNDGQSYNNSLKTVVTTYGSYINENPAPALTNITLSQSELNLKVGESSEPITVTAIPSGASNSVTWATSDANVATVSNGVVTAVSAGTVTITATSTVNSSIKATLTVTVEAVEKPVDPPVDPDDDTALQDFIAKLNAIQSADGMEARYNAIYAAIEAYNALEDRYKNTESEYYQQLELAVVSYNEDAQSLMQPFTQANELASQVVASGVAMSLVAIAVILARRVAGR